MGLNIITQKIKITILISEDKRIVTVAGHNQGTVDRFAYLGSTICEEEM